MRGMLFLGIVGLAGLSITVDGGKELWVGMGASREPQTYPLEWLEAGNKPNNNYAIIGPHAAVLIESVYRIEYRKGQDPKNGRVVHAYHPIISGTHPFIEQLNVLAQEYGGLASIPESKLPEIKDFKVLVRNRRWQNASQIPLTIAPEEKVTGLFIHEIEGLDDDEARLVKEGFPTINLDQILILDEGRAPKRATKAIAQMVGGLLLAGACGFVIVMRFRKS